MSFNQLIKNQVSSAFKTLKDGGLAPEMTYYAVAVGAYDPATDARANVETAYTIYPVMARFAFNEVYDDVSVTTDYKALVPALDLPVTPTQNDYLVDAAGKRYEVRKGLGVPGESLHILHVREV